MEPSVIDINEIESFEIIPNEKTYDLTVEDNSNYYLATKSDPILVHNSGKSTYLKKFTPFLDKSKILKIDADEIRAKLPEYEGWNAANTHLETQDIYRGLLDDLSKGEPCTFDIIWDGTMNKAKNYLPLIGDLRRLNYKIYMIYVNVDPEVSIERAMKRYENPNNEGRYVPLSVLQEAGKKGTEAFDSLKNKADGYMLVNGATGEVVEKNNWDSITERGYFEKEATGNEMKIKKAKLKANARKRRIRILLKIEN